MKKLTVPNAAAQLGITAEALRMRIKRGTVAHEKNNGTVYVLLNTEQTQPNSDHTLDQTLLIETLQDQVDHLKKQLDQANDANRELRRLLAALTSRIPEIPAADTTASQDHTDTTENTPAPAPTSTPAPERRSFWQRLFN